MAFDITRQPEPEREPHREYRDEPIDYVDWAMRIAVFGPLLVLYSHWIWTVLKTALMALIGG